MAGFYPHTHPLARRSDPISSHVAVDSIEKDLTLKDQIMSAVRWHESYPVAPVNDTWLWEWLEDTTGRRFQRNVIARARSLMVHEGLLVGVGPMEYKGRSLEHFERVGRFSETLF